MSDTVIIPKEPAPSVQYGKYQTLAELGEGAMGMVYKCFDPDFQRLVAIKTVHKALLNDASANEFRERFRNEMRAAGKLTHPNIVSVFDAGEHEGCPYFVMEYVEGQELKSLLDSQHQFSVDQCLKLMKGVLRGLSSIHQNGIVHRDLKPANIFVSSDGLAKIADFGIAKLDNSEMTQVGTVIGSPKYMSPEQCLGEPLDARSDLFSFAIILYEMLTGEYCFNASTTSEITQKIMNAQVAPLSTKRQDIPRHLDAVLSKALSKLPEQRYQNTIEFLDALDNKGAPSETDKPAWPLMLGGGVLVGGILAGGLWLYTGSETDPALQIDTGPTELIENAATVGGAHSANNPHSSFPTRPSADQNSDAVQIKSLSPEKSAKLAKLFKVAQTYQRIGRLVSPSGSNAYDAYQIALSIDPGNAEALEGVETVRQSLLTSISDLLAKNETEQALLSISAGLEVFPGDQNFIVLRDQVR